MSVSSTDPESLPPANIGERVLEVVMVLINFNGLPIPPSSHRTINADHWELIRHWRRRRSEIRPGEKLLLNVTNPRPVKAEIKLVHNRWTERVYVSEGQVSKFIRNKVRKSGDDGHSELA